MTDTPERKAALEKLQTDLLDFVVKQLNAGAADGKIPGLTKPFADTISAHVTAAVSKGVEEGISAGKAKAIADEVVAKLKVDAPELFKPSAPQPAVASQTALPSLEADVGTLLKAVKEEKEVASSVEVQDEDPAPAPAPNEKKPKGWGNWASSNWPALVLIVLLIGGIGLLGYASYVQTQQLAAERANSVKLSDDVNGACGLAIEVARETRALEDTLKQTCAVPANTEKDACRNLSKFRRWTASARPFCKLPNP